MWLSREYSWNEKVLRSHLKDLKDEERMNSGIVFQTPGEATDNA